MPEVTRSAEDGIEYSFISEYSYATKMGLWLAWYPNIPYLKGTGDSKVLAFKDLRSRERLQRTDGEISFWALGNKMFAREDGSEDYGIGSSSSDALADLICRGTNVRMTFQWEPKECLWYCSLGQDSAGFGPTARKAHEQAHHAMCMKEAIGFNGVMVRTSKDSWSVSKKGSSIVGTGTTADEAVRSWRAAWSRELLEACASMAGHLSSYPSRNDIEDLITYFQELEKKANGSVCTAS